MYLVCEDCDEENNTVDATVCPYAEEINEEVVPVNLCPNSYKERCQDI